MRGQWARSDRLKGLQSEGPSSLLLADPSSYPSIFEATDEFEAAEEIQGPGFAGLGLPNKLVRALANQGITDAVPDPGRDHPRRARRPRRPRPRPDRLGQDARLRPAAAGPARGERPRRAAPPKALILVPTRELAMQVNDALSRWRRRSACSCKTAVGGVAVRPADLRARARRRRARRHAGPARRPDQARRLLARPVEITVLDEADQMADMGFLPEVTELLDADAGDAASACCSPRPSTRTSTRWSSGS